MQSNHCRDEIDGGVLDSSSSDIGATRSSGVSRKRAARQECARAQDRCVRLSVDQYLQSVGLLKASFRPPEQHPKLAEARVARRRRSIPRNASRWEMSRCSLPPFDVPHSFLGIRVWSPPPGPAAVIGMESKTRKSGLRNRKSGDCSAVAKNGTKRTTERRRLARTLRPFCALHILWTRPLRERRLFLPVLATNSCVAEI